MKLYILLTIIMGLTASISFAGENCADPYNQFSNIPLSKTQTELAQCQFLACDLASSEGAVGTLDAEVCSSVYELVRIKIFNKDFNALLAWWQTHKGRAEYDKNCGTVNLESVQWKSYYSGLDSCKSF